MAAASTASRNFGRAFTRSPSHERALVHRCARGSRITIAFTATVNGQRLHGAFAETITVTGGNFVRITAEVEF
jgi:hypothetical protein